jgi:hypothetical protein
MISVAKKERKPLGNGGFERPCNTCYQTPDSLGAKIVLRDWTWETFREPDRPPDLSLRL